MWISATHAFALVAATLLSTMTAQVSVQVLADLAPGNQSSTPDAFCTLGDRVLFTANGHADLWISDGTTVGTSLIVAGLGGIRSPHSLGDRLVFVAGSLRPEGQEPWVTDGTAAGTRLLADLWPGAAGSRPDWMTVHDGAVWFVAATSLGSLQVCRSDGTSTGTGPGAPPMSLPYWLFSAGSRLCWLGDSPSFPGVAVLWSTDRQGSRALPLTRMGNGLPVAFGERIVLAQEDGAGIEPWITDGTPAGTRRLADVRPGPLSCDPESFVAAGGRVFFSADDGVHGRELWVTDGTTAGTLLVIDLNPGVGNGFVSNHEQVAVAGERLVFYGYTPVFGAEPFASDGTAAGTVLLADVVPGPTNATLGSIEEFGTGQAWFHAHYHVNGWPVAYAWMTDGTPQRTRPLTPASGPQRLAMRGPAAVNGRILTLGEDAALGFEPFSVWGLAVALRLDHGCGGDGSRPILRMGDPVLGSTATLRGDAAPQSVAIPIVGAVADPFAIGTCKWHVGMPHIVLPPFAVSGTWSTGLTVPNVAALQGATFSVQVLFAGTGGPFGLHFSDALLGIVGS